MARQRRHVALGWGAPTGVEWQRGPRRRPGAVRGGGGRALCTGPATASHAPRKMCGLRTAADGHGALRAGSDRPFSGPPLSQPPLSPLNSQNPQTLSKFCFAQLSATEFYFISDKASPQAPRTTTPRTPPSGSEMAISSRSPFLRPLPQSPLTPPQPHPPPTSTQRQNLHRLPRPHLPEAYNNPPPQPPLHYPISTVPNPPPGLLQTTQHRWGGGTPPPNRLDQMCFRACG